MEEIMRGALCLVQGFVPGALRLGYRRAPVVIAVGGEPRRVSIAQFESGWVDLRTAKNLLDSKEPGWGGSTTLIGSPQGVEVKTPLTSIIDTVRSYLINKGACA